MASTHLPVVGGHAEGPGETLRTDRWWLGPMATVAVFSSFILYATWAAFQGEHYYADPYLSPFYSPIIFTEQSAAGSAPLWHAWVGDWPKWWPSILPASPAFFIMAFPGAFRTTCYYYRKAYYRSFFGSPPGCAVNPLPPNQPKYWGETSFLVLQNLHRFALYGAICFIPILYFDAFVSFFRHTPDGQWVFGMGVGTFVLLTNATLLACYTFGCHSFRHLIAGHDDCMSCGQNTLKYGAWKRVSWLNQRHMLFAWCSLLWVGFTDVYVRLVSMGIITDFNTWDM